MNKIFLVCLLFSFYCHPIAKIGDSKSFKILPKRPQLTAEQKEKLKEQREEEKKRQEKLKEQNEVSPEKDEALKKCFHDYKSKHDEIKNDFQEKKQKAKGSTNYDQKRKNVKEYWSKNKLALEDLRKCGKDIYPTNRKHVTKIIKEDSELSKLSQLVF